MSDFEIKDSGQREAFGTGAHRDTREGKGRYDLISPHMMRRLAVHLEKGAAKYGDRNWEKGMPFSRNLDSVLRHIFQYISGERIEDNLAAAIFGLMITIHFEEEGRAAELNDLPWAASAAEKSR